MLLKYYRCLETITTYSVAAHFDTNESLLSNHPMLCWFVDAHVIILCTQCPGLSYPSRWLLVVAVNVHGDQVNEYCAIGLPRPETDNV